VSPSLAPAVEQLSSLETSIGLEYSPCLVAPVNRLHGCPAFLLTQDKFQEAENTLFGLVSAGQARPGRASWAW
jgi:hypothetical protein